MNLSSFHAGAWWFLETMSWPRVEAQFSNAERGTGNEESPEAPLAARPSHDAYGAAIQQMKLVDGVAIVPVKGALLKNAHPLAKRYGFAGYEDVAEDLIAARAQGVRGVVLDISSPGGMAVSAGELGAFVADFAAHTPVFSFTDSMQCSAAEYLSGACTGRFATADAIVGSIGTVMTTVSFEGMLKKEGIKAEVFASGPYKAAGHPLKDLTPAQTEYLQGFVDTLAGEFKGHMQTHRRGLGEESMQGQVFTGRQGAQNGLLDGTVRGLEEVIAFLK